MGIESTSYIGDFLPSAESVSTSFFLPCFRDPPKRLHSSYLFHQLQEGTHGLMRRYPPVLLNIAIEKGYFVR